MANYLLIESRDPFETNDVVHDYGLATELAKAGNQVTLFLVQNGVLPARSCAHSEKLTDLSKNQVKVLADSYSLRERAIAGDKLVEGVSVSELDVVVDAMAAGDKTVWL